jgi:phosphorylcholine metabolism protein LicD
MGKTIFILILFFIVFLFFYCLKKNNKEPFSQSKDKSDINICYSNVMSYNEDKILNQLLNIWFKVSGELGIRWSICAGSYIGAIRHKGRIPWDDDFDLTIMKEDLPKLNSIDKILSKYNVSIAKFWGGYKIFFNDHRGIQKFHKYGWNWPFIDIFATDKDINNRAKMECFFLNKNEFPLRKQKFGNNFVYIYDNPSKERPCIKKQKWRDSYLDTGYRHQIEKSINSKCQEKFYKIKN